MPVEFEIRVVKVGNSLRVTIPREIARSMKLKAGDTVGISLTDDKAVIRKL